MNKQAQTSKIIIGVDPGTIATGYGIVKLTDSKYQLLDYGCIKPPSTSKLSSRYAIIYDAILILLDKYRPDALSIETQFVRLNAQVAIKLGMARGVVVLAAYKQGLAIHEYSPKEAKLAVTGTGNASKHQVNRMIQQIFCLPLPPTPEDASDALALALCLAHHLQTAKNLGKEF